VKKTGRSKEGTKIMEKKRILQKGKGKEIKKARKIFEI
jgi:hypothetical protein